jgi:DNA-directed RNA polymerase specialized sigma24 family protein
MASANRYPGIDPGIVACVRHHARRIAGQIPGMEVEDLEQELMLQAHRRLDAYDPARAQLRTFVDRVLRNFCSHLLDAAGALRRNPGQSLLFGGRLRPSARDAAPALDLGWDATSEPAAEQEWWEQAHLQCDLERILAALPQHLAECCRWLIDGSTADAARRSGLARGSIHSRVVTLRRYFAAAELHTYLALPARQF